MIDIKMLCFWIGIIGVIFAGILGIFGVWVPEFWKNEFGGKLIITSVIITVTSLAACAILNWLK